MGSIAPASPDPTKAAMSQSKLIVGLVRGFSERCPNCGKGQLFWRYLKVLSPCPVCGNDNAQYPSDDAPPYFTILLIGHLVIAPMLFFPFIWTWPVGWVLAVTMPTIAILTLVLLPRVKGAVIGAQWAIHRTEGAVPGVDDDRPRS
jgi:uncharacterized protein (DUF983 family)